MLDSRQIHPMSDFLRNHKAHVARMKETHIPEVLTVNGRAEIVMLDTETYENMVEQLNQIESIAAVRTLIRQANASGPREEIPETEMKRRRAIMQELVEETERLGLYR